MITAKQIKAARALIDWSQQTLADQCDMSKTAIANIESGQSRPTDRNMTNILNAFDRAGVEFITDGVREKGNLIQVYEGKEGIISFYNDVAMTAEARGGEFLVYGVNEEDFVKAAQEVRINEVYRLRIKNAQEKHPVIFKVIVCDEDSNENAAPHCEYRQLPSKMVFTDAPFYIYGDKIALIVWKDKPKFIIISDSDLTEAYRRQFNFLWQYAGGKDKDNAK